MLKSKVSKLILTLIIVFVALVALVNIRTIYELVSSKTDSSVMASSNENFVYLSDLPYDFAESDWTESKPIILNSNKSDEALSLLVDGKQQQFLKGLFTHATSTVIYDISDLNYNFFSTYVGIDNSSDGNGNGVIFTISVSNDLNNWIIKDTTDVLTVNSESVQITVDVEGYKYLKLYADDNGNRDSDYAVYADAKLYYTEDNVSHPTIEIEQTEYNKDDLTIFNFDINSVEEKDLDYFKSLIKITDEKNVEIDNNSDKVEFILDEDFSWEKEGTYSLIVRVNDSNGNTEELVITIYLIDSSIKVIPIGELNIVIYDSNLSYNGKEQTPVITITDSEGYVLIPDVDYTLEFSNNINAGEEAIVIIKGLGKYEGETEKLFTIRKKVQPDPEDIPFTELIVSSKTMTAGNIILPDGWVWDKDDVKLVEGKNILKIIFLGDSNNERYELEVIVIKEVVPTVENSKNNSNTTTNGTVFNSNVRSFDESNIDINDSEDEANENSYNVHFEGSESTVETNEEIDNEEDKETKEKCLKIFWIIGLVILLILIFLYLIYKKEKNDRKKHKSKRKAKKRGSY